MDDLVQRLRGGVNFDAGEYDVITAFETMNEAAARIEALESALRQLLDSTESEMRDGDLARELAAKVLNTTDEPRQSGSSI